MMPEGCASCGQGALFGAAVLCRSCYMAQFPPWYWKCEDCKADLPPEAEAIVVMIFGVLPNEVLCPACASKRGLEVVRDPEAVQRYAVLA